jgi:predicted RNA-binding protein with PIN domain
MRRLTRLLAAFAAETGEPVTVVFDGQPFDLSDPPVNVVFASTRGRNAADHDIAAMALSDTDPSTLRVVTSDRALAERVRAAGVEVAGAGPFRRRLEGLEQQQ